MVMSAFSVPEVVMGDGDIVTSASWYGFDLVDCFLFLDVLVYRLHRYYAKRRHATVCIGAKTQHDRSHLACSSLSIWSCAFRKLAKLTLRFHSLSGFFLVVIHGQAHGAQLDARHAQTFCARLAK
eukprot:1223324-Amphidinium_carterae.2